jgi:geranylgeranyl diphosphate synthase, type II
LSGSAFELAGYLQRWAGEVDRVLDLVLAPAEAGPASLHAAMRYSVFAGGKRLRPVLVIAACEAVGGEPGRCLRTGAAIEMVHTYSLIHDDLPAMDDDDLRRGAPTCHKKFGEAAAILAGDGLLTEAFGVIAEDQALPAEIRVRLIAGLVRAAGARGMVAGQAVDIAKEGAAFTAADVEYIHAHKTAAMIENAVDAGAVIGGAGESERAALAAYGRAVGLAFQIVDDVLNVTGGKDLGKGVGTDAARGKATYPAVAGLDGARQRAREELGRALAALAGFDRRAEALRALAERVVDRDR